MRLETLRCAERAAGFAMAGVDDFVTENAPELEVQSDLEPRSLAWTPAEPLLGSAPARPLDGPLGRQAAHSSAQAVADWLRGLVGLAPGRRAHA